MALSGSLFQSPDLQASESGSCYIWPVKVISRYLISRFLYQFLGALLALVLVVLAAEILIHLSALLEDKGSWSQAMGVILLQIPAGYFRILFPVAAFFSAFMTIGLAARNREVLAIKACGMSPVRLLIPMMVTSFGLAVATLWLFETGVLAASRALLRIEQGEERFVIEGDALWFNRANTLFRIRDGDLKDRTLRGVTIYYRDELGRLERSISAARAEMEGSGRWALEDVVVREFDTGDATRPMRSMQMEELKVQGLHPRSLVPFDPERRVLSLRQLRKRIRIQLREGTKPVALRAQYQERLTDPWLVFLCPLFAAPLGFKVEKARSLSRPAMQGVALIAIVWSLRGLGSELALKGVLAPVFAQWGLLILLLAVGVVFARKAQD